MSEDRFQLLERGGLVPSGALERAVQAGLKSNPRRFADALFRVPRNANLFSVLRGQVECGAISVEPGLFGDLVEASSEWGATPKALVALESGNAVVPEGFVDWLMKQGSLEQYTLIDEYKSGLVEKGQGLCKRFPGLNVVAVEGDLREGVRYLKLESPKDKWVLWTGGAINHHDPSVSEHLLRYVGAGLQGDESLLLGVDLRDDMEALHSLLSHEAVGEQERGLIAYLNQELNLGLAPGGFRFQVNIDETICRLVLQLVAEEPMDFGSLGASLKAGDAIDTGYVYVYEKATVKSVIQKAGLSLVGEWIDRSQEYGLFLLRRATGQP